MSVILTRLHTSFISVSTGYNEVLDTWKILNKYVLTKGHKEPLFSTPVLTQLAFHCTVLAVIVEVPLET